MASSEVYEVGIVSSNTEAVAAMNAAIATKDIAKVKEAAAYWSDAAIAARAAAAVCLFPGQHFGRCLGQCDRPPAARLRGGLSRLPLERHPLSRLQPGRQRHHRRRGVPHRR